jgi:hypothetical protein
MKPSIGLLAFGCILFAPITAPAQQYGFPGGPGAFVAPRGYRTVVGYRGIVTTRPMMGGNPAAGQLRSFPLVAAPLAVTGVPGDPAGTFTPPLQTDVTFMGPPRYMAGYRGTVRPPVFNSPTGGSGLPLVQFGGFADNIAPIEFAYPLSSTAAGYNGTLAPVSAMPMAPMIAP